MNKVQTAAAVTGGYLLGRFHKARWALALAGGLAGRQLRPGARQGTQGRDNDGAEGAEAHKQAGGLVGRLPGDVAGAARSALVTLAAQRMEALSERMAEGTASLRARSGQDEDADDSTQEGEPDRAAEAEEAAEEPDDTEETAEATEDLEEPDESDGEAEASQTRRRGTGRRSGKAAGGTRKATDEPKPTKGTTAKQAPARKSAGEKQAADRPRGRAKKTTSSRGTRAQTSGKATSGGSGRGKGRES